MANIEDFIVAQLDSAGIDFWMHREFIHVSCPFHPHSGTKKKLGFSRASGGMHCWVCQKKGHWNEFAALHGLEKFGPDDARLHDFNWLAKEFDRIEARANRQPENPDWVLPWQRGVWRGIPPEFLFTVPSYEWYDEGSRANRILWPVYVNGKFKGCTTARIDPDDATVKPKNRNLGGLDTPKILFPFDHPTVIDAKAVVLVEGQFDAIRLLYHGVPAVSIMGVGNWDDHKLTLLGIRGYKRLVIAFDGDLAGERLTDEVIEDAKSMFDVRTLPFPNPDEKEKARGINIVDPGNCKMKYVNMLKRMALAA